MTDCPYCGPDRKCGCCDCGAPCPYFGDETAPVGACEGPVECVDEERSEDDWWWVHRCAKHTEFYIKNFY